MIVDWLASKSVGTGFVVLRGTLERSGDRYSCVPILLYRMISQVASK